MSTLTVETTHGPAEVDLRLADPSRALLVMLPGASGKPFQDLFTVADAAQSDGVTTAVVTPPYAVAGKKVPPRAPAADDAFLQVVAALLAEFGEQPLIVGGRSFGSRVACRTSSALGAVGVLCLAFPLHPPGKPEQSRLADLEAAVAPTLVIQGRTDAFGCPPPADHRAVVMVEGDHSLKKEHDRIATTVTDWLNRLL